jgi:hypothetical protein
MGGGNWSAWTYDTTVKAAKEAGKSTFAHSTTTKAKPTNAWTAHSALDPKGVDLRESRDSDEHPTSVAVAVLFDVTGSMHVVPQTLQMKLPELFGLLLRKGYVEHPQILFGAIGDAFADRVPLQVGQFESDNRIDENLGNIFLEGNGGGQKSESYELAMYFMLKHTAIDCLEKRGKRGYLFIIGDEMAYPKITPSQVETVIGDKIGEPIDTAILVKDLQQMYDVYYIMPTGSMHYNDSQVTGMWRDLLGQNFILLDDLDATCETIALAIGMGEGSIDLDAGVEDLKELGSTHGATVSKALATVGSKGAVAESAGPTDLDASSGGAARL